MTVGTTIPQKPSSANVAVVASPEDTRELWVIPSKKISCPDLRSLRHLLPADYRSAPVVEFHPMLHSDTWGAWVLRREV